MMMRMLAAVTLLLTSPLWAGDLATTLPDTGQVKCYSARGETTFPRRGAAYYGQDAQYAGRAPSYRDNRDGTVSDLVTGLMWSKAVAMKKLSLIEAQKAVKTMKLAGHNDWRVPTIKELYSLIDFRGYTGAGGLTSQAPASAVPYINTDFFDFAFGQTSAGERYIDAQWLSSNVYVSTTMGGAKTLFGVNFADGRIKGYGYSMPGGRRAEKKFYVRYVRGAAYGKNGFSDNGDGTITDASTGLMWTKADSGKGMNWAKALTYAEGLTASGHSDWRLPDAKELQGIVDYTRSPDTTRSPSIDPNFQTTAITNEAKQRDYPFFWTSTTHLDGPVAGSNAAYICFGRGIGQMRGTVMDVHGAGCQRSDPKTGKGGIGHGPQGDARRVKNFVRCVRGGAKKLVRKAQATSTTGYPAVIRFFENGKEITRKPTAAAARPGGKQGKGGPPSFVSRLDKDGDGKVSRKEFDGPSRHFKMLDKNGDGYIAADEAPTGPPPGGRPPKR